MSKLTERVTIGLPITDESFGGAFKDRPLLCIGQRGAGKTLAALQFIKRGLEAGESTLMLSEMPATNLIELGEKMGIPLSSAISERQIAVVEYETLLGTPPLWPISVQDFSYIMRYVETQRIGRLVLDTVVPWVALDDPAALREHVEVFMEELDHVGATTLITLPRAVSPLAQELTKMLTTLTPLSLEINCLEGDEREINVLRCLGQVILPKPQKYLITTNEGLVYGR
jgi:KaiC/GvpD/RAD55 family RecA-like ATPase